MVEKSVIYTGIIVILLVLLFNLSAFIVPVDTLVMNLRSVPLEKAEQNASPEIARQLALVPSIMKFGDSLGFAKTDAYSRYYLLKRETAYYILSASKKDSFEEKKWRVLFFSFPYTEFVDKADASLEQRVLNGRGYDTYLRNADAASSLGWYPDPILPTMINTTDPTVLIYTLFHERTHQTLFNANDVRFDETAAVLIGLVSMRDFAREHYGIQSREFALANARINDALTFSDFIDSFHSDLEKIYASKLSPEEKIEHRQAIFLNYHVLYNQLNLSVWFTNVGEKEFNNAMVLSYYRYYGRLGRYHDVYTALGHDAPITIKFFTQFSRESDPDAAVERFLAKH